MIGEAIWLAHCTLPIDPYLLPLLSYTPLVLTNGNNGRRGKSLPLILRLDMSGYAGGEIEEDNQGSKLLHHFLTTSSGLASKESTIAMSRYFFGTASAIKRRWILFSSSIATMVRSGVD